MSQWRGGFWGVISRGKIEGSGIRRKGGRYVQGLQLRPRGPGGWWTKRIFSEEIVTGWRELWEEAIALGQVELNCKSRSSIDEPGFEI